MKLVKILLLITLVTLSLVSSRKIKSKKTVTETSILGGKATVYSSGQDKTKAEIYSHGEWDDSSKPKFKQISGLTLKYYAPDNRTLLGGLGIIGDLQPKNDPDSGDWFDYDLKKVNAYEIGVTDNDLKQIYNNKAGNISHDLVIVNSNVKTSVLLAELNKLGYKTVWGNHCRIHASSPDNDYVPDKKK